MAIYERARTFLIISNLLLAIGVAAKRKFTFSQFNNETGPFLLFKFIAIVFLFTGSSNSSSV